METSKKQISLFTEDKSTSSQADSPANHTQQQAEDLERKMTVTSGLKCLEQLERFSHVGLWAKTFVGLLIGMEDWYSRRCRLTWKMKGTKFNRLYFQLQVSTLHTKETECGLLLKTPCAMDAHVVSGKKNPTSGNSGTLAQEIMSGYQPTMEKLKMPMNGLLPTLSATDSPKKNTGKRNQDSIPKRIKDCGGSTLQFNPLFCAEMMGFPESWTLSPFLNGETNQSKPTETQ